MKLLQLYIIGNIQVISKAAEVFFQLCFHKHYLVASTDQNMFSGIENTVGSW